LTQFRDFDESGVDKALITSIEFPEKIENGIFVIRFKAEGNTATDAIGFSDILELADSPASNGMFNVQIPDLEDAKIGELSGDVAKISLEDFVAGSGNLLEHLHENSSGAVLDVMIHDDTRIDFFGLALCQKPLFRKGATMSVDTRDYTEANLSAVTCSSDPNQRPCDPLVGDTLCSEAVPLGCYNEGTRAIPDNIIYFTGNYVGGEIKVTEPVRGDIFHSLAEATEFCTANFGASWRTLSYHEAGGAVVLSYSDVPARTRMWVDIKDKPAAACWRNNPAVTGTK
jgi:hypothetical protein